MPFSSLWGNPMAYESAFGVLSALSAENLRVFRGQEAIRAGAVSSTNSRRPSLRERSDDGVERPRTWYALQFVFAPGLEGDAGADEQRRKCARREDLPRLCKRHHPRGDVHRDAADVSV